MKYGTNEHIYVCVYLIASSKGKYIDEASERKKRRMCKKKKRQFVDKNGERYENNLFHPYPTVCTKSQMSEMTNNHIQNHYFEYERVNKIDKIF